MPTPPLQTGPVMLSQSPVPWSILRQNPFTIEGEFGATGGFWSGTVDFRVAARDVYAFCQFAAGAQYTVSMGSSGTVTRYIPVSHPDVPTMICTKIKATGKGGYTATNTLATSNWSDMAVSLGFSMVPFPVDGSGPMLTTETRAGAEVYTLAGSKLKFPSDSTPVQADAGITVPTLTYTVTCYLTVGLNDAVLNPLVGTVNNGTFLGQSAGTMRFDGYSSSAAMTGGGQLSYTRTLLLAWRPIPWNQFLRPDGVWEAVQKPNTSNVYAAADLSPLIA